MPGRPFCEAVLVNHRGCYHTAQLIHTVRITQVSQALDVVLNDLSEDVGSKPSEWALSPLSAHTGRLWYDIGQDSNDRRRTICEQQTKQ